MNEKFVTDNKEYIYGKDTDGNIITFKQIQEKILQIALEIDRICRKYDIPYAFGFGSALGINNYGGFIPWDDDIDVVIPYERFDDFVQACKEDIGDEYVFDCYENNKKYNILIPTGKFRLKNTFYKEIYTITLPNKCGSGKTLFVDIVTFMGVPEDPKEHYKLIKKVKTLRNYGSDRRYHNIEVGFNARLDELQAALLSVKLRHIDELTNERKEAAKFYLDNIKNDKIILPKTADYAEHVYHQFVIRCGERDELIKYLDENNVGTIIHYPIPPHLSKAYEYLGVKKGELPITEKYADQVLSIPMYNGITKEIQQYVVDVLNKF